MTRHEPSLRGTFNEVPYQILLKSCRTILHKISQARISSIYFSIHDHDYHPDVTQKLLSLRRDAVASVIFCFYILAGAFRSKNRVPCHLPSAPMSRKLLFDAMLGFHHQILEQETSSQVELDATLENHFPNTPHHNLFNAGHKKPFRDRSHLESEASSSSSPASSNNDRNINDKKSELVECRTPQVMFSKEDKAHKLWAIVHETSFSRTFTEIAEELEKIISYSKFILGEEEL